MCSDRVLLLVTDAVEKGFFSFDRVRLIQDQAQARNVDSKNQSSRFDCCVFLFHSFRAVTFSTASTHMRHGRNRNRETGYGIAASGAGLCGTAATLYSNPFAFRTVWAAGEERNVTSALAASV